MKHFLAGAAAALTMAAATEAGALGYTVTDLGSLGGNSYATGINDSGQVVGYSRNGSGYEAFLYSGGAMTGLGTLGEPYSYAYGINNSGQIAGFSHNGSGYEAFLYSGGVMTGLGTLGGPYSFAYGINDSGEVVGHSHNGSYPEAFLYSGGVMTGLGTLGGTYSYAYGINDNGQVAGYSHNGGNNEAFLYSGGTMTGLGTLGGGSSYAFGINDSGQVVGNSDGCAFFYTGGSMYDLNDLIDPGLGVTLTEARAINASVQIAVYGRNAQGQYHAMLLTPNIPGVPLPAGFPLLLVGLGSFGALGLRRRRRW